MSFHLRNGKLKGVANNSIKVPNLRSISILSIDSLDLKGVLHLNSLPRLLIAISNLELIKFCAKSFGICKDENGRIRRCSLRKRLYPPVVELSKAYRFFLSLSV